MTNHEPTISGFREMLNQCYAAARGMLRRTPDDASMLAGIDQYRRIFAILGSMTKEEQDAPLEIIDSERIRRISSSAETTDQEVIKTLFSYREYCEGVLRARRLDNR